MMRTGRFLGGSLFLAGLLGVACVVPKAGPNLPVDQVSALPPEVAEKVRLLYSKDTTIRAQAAIDLGAMGAAAAPAIPYLVGMLDDDHGRVLLEPAASEFFKGSSAAEEFLTRKLTRGLCPGNYAALALVKIGPASVEPLIAAVRMTWKDGIVEQVHIPNASWALATLGDRRAVEPLIRDVVENPRLHEDHYVSLAASVVASLGRFKGDERALAAVTRILEKRASPPKDAVVGDGELTLRDHSGVRLLNSVDGVWVRSLVVLAAIGAAAQLGDERAVPPLIDLLKEGEFAATSTVALKEISGQDFGNDREKWASWWKARER